MEAPRRDSPILPVLLLAAAMVTMTIPGGSAATDPREDELDPSHDILAANVTADRSTVNFAIEMADDVREPAQDEEEFVIEFGVAMQTTSAAGADEPTTRYSIQYGSATSPSPYYLYTNYTAVSAGSELAEQPSSGSPNITFTVQRSNLESAPGQGAEEGDRIVDVRVKYLHNGTVTDEIRPEGVTLPAADRSPDRRFHLTSTGDEPFPQRSLDEEGPVDGETRTAAVEATKTVTWSSDVFERPFSIDNGTAQLWLSFTSTSPFLSITAVDAELNLRLPDGSVETIAERDTGSNPFIFTTPGVPQKVTWDLVFTRSEVPAGAQLELELVAEGALGEGMQGPVVAYHNSTEFDSQLLLEGEAGAEPTIPATDPALGTHHYYLRGFSGEMGAQADEAKLETVPAVGDANTTLAAWETDTLDRATTIENVVADVWISPSTATPFIALDYLDARLFAVEDGEATLLAQRAVFADDGANPNVFTQPASPQRFTWDLALERTQVPAGAQLRLAITAESLPGLTPSEATVYTQGGSASKIVLDAADVNATAGSEEVSTNETVEFSGQIEAGEGPWTYHWTFDDGTRTDAAVTSDRNVSVEHAYEEAGSYEPTLVVRDATGAAGGDSASVTVVADATDTVSFSDVRADPTLPKLGALEISWSTDVPGDSTVHYGPSADSLDQTVTVEENVTEHTVTLDGLDTATTYAYQVETNNDTSDVHQATTAGDFTGDSHTVIAYVDTGINPYHETFQRPDRIAHPSTYLDGFPASAEPLELATDAPTYSDAIQQDRGEYKAIEEGELRWIPGTNVIAAIDKGDASAANSADDTTPILDDDGHGTAVAGTITNANPDVLLTTIEGLTADGIGWAAQQPWIDVISVSSASTFPSAGQSVPDAYDQVLENGKLVVYAAGNTPNPDVLFPPTSYPQTISVGGAHPDVNGTEPIASKTPDVVSNFTVRAPTPDSTDETTSISGTSFATPNVAGTISKALLDLREHANATGEDTTTGFAPVPTDSPYGEDGVVDNHELWDALNRSAAYWSTDEWTPSLTTPPAPGAPWLTMGWGFQGPSTAGALAETALGEIDPTKPQAAQTYMEADREVHEAYNTPARDEIAGAAEGTSVPGPRVNVTPLAEPIETEHPYRPDANRTWTVQVDGAQALSLHFQNFTVETGFDRVQLEDPSGTVHAVYSQTSGADFWSVPVPSDEVVVRLVSDGGLQRYGFSVDAVDVIG